MLCFKEKERLSLRVLLIKKSLSIVHWEIFAVHQHCGNVAFTF